MTQPSPPPQSNPTDNETRRTRSGRVSKPPERYEPIEQVEDDYAPEDYDTDESDVSSEVSYDESEIEEEGDDDLDDFVVPDKSESDEEDNDGEPPVSGPKRPVPKKRGGRKN